MQKALSLNDIISVTHPTPLDGKDLDTFYVDVDQARNSTIHPSFLLRRYLSERSNIVRILLASHPAVPLFLVNSPDRQQLESNFIPLTLPMVKTHHPNGEVFSDGYRVLREVINRRIDVDRLIDPAALDLAIEKTGGVLRDMLRVIREASDVALFRKADKISSEAIRYSLNQLKSRLRQSVTSPQKEEIDALYSKLVDIAQSRGKPITADIPLQKLLYSQSVLEYNSEYDWYDLHPLMRENLIEMGKLNELA